MNNNTVTNGTLTNITTTNTTNTNTTEIIKHLTAEENLRNEELTGFLTGVGLLGMYLFKI